MTKSRHKRSITIARHRTSISLEDAFWDALSTFAEADGKSVADLVSEIDRRRGGTAQRRDDRDQGGELLGGGIALHDAEERRGGLLVRRRHSGMFPCFLAGRISRLERSSRSALTMSSRVSWGEMTPST